MGVDEAMSTHRYPCTAEPPPPILGGEGSHQHACIHDAAPSGCDIPVEHECDCGMTWTASTWTPRPVPPDPAWVLEPAKRSSGWPWVLGACALVLLISGLVITLGTWVTR